jgi:uncharacterized membrane protein
MIVGIFIERLFRRFRLHWRLAEFILFLMIIGPLIAPYFQAIPNPLYQAVARFIFGLGSFVCPQPQFAPVYDGQLFAVCYRCYMAVFGLVIARVLNRPGGPMRAWTFSARFGFLLINLLWLTIDVQFTHLGVWGANIPLMMVHGLVYGVSVGGVVFSALIFIDDLMDRKRTKVPALIPQSQP